MNRSIIPTLVAAALLAYPASALGADPAPDVKGKWIGKTHTILVGKGGHWPKGRGTWDKPALLEKDLVIDITGQDGRRFWGVTTISGGGEKTDEAFIGELTGKDNKSFVFADADGFWNGRAAGASPPQSAARRSSERADLALWDFDPACDRFGSGSVSPGRHLFRTCAIANRDVADTTVSIRQLTKLCDDARRHVQDLTYNVVHLFAATAVNDQVPLLSGSQEGRVIEHVLKRCTQGVEPVLRYPWRCDDRASDFCRARDRIQCRMTLFLEGQFL